MLNEFPAQETTFLLPGPVGDIEVLATPADSEAVATAIICHPHSLHGGTMQNKVVTTLARAFRDLGLRTVRFNFRGVGKTAGKYSDGIGETDDLLAIIQWVRACFPKQAIWLAGFSFGSFVAARAATQVSVAQLVTVAPAVVRFNFNDLPDVHCPWLVIQGDKDEVVSPDQVYDWVETRQPQPRVIRMPTAGHFFHGLLLELRENIVNALK